MLDLVRDRVISDLKEFGKKRDYFFSEDVLVDEGKHSNYVIRSFEGDKILLEGEYDEVHAGLGNFSIENLIWILQQIEENNYHKTIEEMHEADGRS